MPIPIMIARYAVTRPDAAVYVRRTWKGPVVVKGERPGTLIRVDRPDRVTIPLGPNPGAVTREAEARNLVAACPDPVDVYVVEVTEASGQRGYGMIAVPHTTVPTFGTW